MNITFENLRDFKLDQTIYITFNILFYLFLSYDELNGIKWKFIFYSTLWHFIKDQYKVFLFIAKSYFS